MKAIKFLLAFFRMQGRDASASDAALLGHLMGLIVGFCDGRDDRQYDDGSSRVHDLTVCIPGIGSSAFAAGYRDGFLSGQGERLKTT